MRWYPSSREVSVGGLVCLCAAASLPISAQVISTSLFRQYKVLNPTIERAFTALKARRPEEARGILKPCLDAIPNHFEAHYILALIDFEARDYQGVLVHLDVSERTLSALDRGYRDHVAEMNAGAEARAQEAEDNYNTAVSRNYTRQSGLKQDALIAEEGTKPSKNLENPYGIPADYLFLRGNALLRLGRREESRVAYRRAVEADPMHGNAWNNLIALGLGSKDLATAREDLAKAEHAGVTIRPELKKAVQEAH